MCNESKQKDSVTINGVQPKQNRTFKDSVFTDVFYSDENAKENLLSLYNALAGTTYTDSSIIQKVRLEDVLFKNLKNDIAFTVNNSIIVLGEHQSTKNQNMPLRMLLYVAREYERITESDDRYKEGMIKIPTPIFYVFYNGTDDDVPTEEIQKLSDALMVKGTNDEIPIELIVHVININTDKGHEILSKCKILKEYSLFVDCVRSHPQNVNGFKAAIKECIEKGILADYLKRNGSEVINMLMAEYDYDTDVSVKAKESFNKGFNKAIALTSKLISLGKLSEVKALDNVSEKEIDELCKKYDI